jgi:hypothetical protein
VDRIEEMAKLLLEKLSKEQLSMFCDMYDDGSFMEVVDFHLIPKDAENFPAKYAS